MSSSRVDFPSPSSPMRTARSPGFSVNEKSFRMVRLSLRCVTVRSFICSIIISPIKKSAFRHMPKSRFLQREKDTAHKCGGSVGAVLYFSATKQKPAEQSAETFCVVKNRLLAHLPTHFFFNCPDYNTALRFLSRCRFSLELGQIRSRDCCARPVAFKAGLFPDVIEPDAVSDRAAVTNAAGSAFADQARHAAADRCAKIEWDGFPAD